MAKKENSAVEKTAVRKRKTAEKAPEKAPEKTPEKTPAEEMKVNAAAEMPVGAAERPVEEQTASGPAVYTAEEVNAMLADMKAQMEALQEKLAAQTAPVSIVAAAPEEKVVLRWQAPVADENVLEIGQNGRWGRITGKVGTVSVPKSEMGNVLTPMIRSLLDRRWLIVLSGLDEADQEAYGVRYKAGEVLDKAAFSNLLKLGEALVPVYKGLCPGNKEIVEKLVYEKWAAKRKADRGLMEELNRAAKECGRADNAFREILREMNAEEAE